MIDQQYYRVSNLKLIKKGVGFKSRISLFGLFSLFEEVITNSVPGNKANLIYKPFLNIRYLKCQSF